MRDEKEILSTVTISPELILEGERVLREKASIRSKIDAIHGRVRVLLAERDLLEAQEDANSDAFFADVYKVHPELERVDCSYSTERKAIVIYKDEPVLRNPADMIKHIIETAIAAQAQPPKEGAN